MAERLTDRLVKALKAPAKGNKVTYDAEIAGFGCRVTAGNAKAFVLNYRFEGRERRLTIGPYPGWTLSRARQRAKELRVEIDRGNDPLAEKTALRDAPTVADMVDRFRADHLPKLREKTRIEYASIIESYILPTCRHAKVGEVTLADVDGWHREWSKRAPYRANRAVSILSRMFGLCRRWGWRTDNPCAGVEKNAEVKRERFLTPEEVNRLTKALGAHHDQQAADVIRMLLFTGARRGEVLAMRWDQIDRGIWTKPAATTKQKKSHRVPLSPPALALLETIGRSSEWVFPSSRVDGPRQEIKNHWKAIRTAAGIDNCRIHDLRHHFASMLASDGMSLPVIGQMLGHTQPATTARYAHLADDPLRAAAARAGQLIGGPTRH